MSVRKAIRQLTKSFTNMDEMLAFFRQIRMVPDQHNSQWPATKAPRSTDDLEPLRLVLQDFAHFHVFLINYPEMVRTAKHNGTDVQIGFENPVQLLRAMHTVSNLVNSPDGSHIVYVLAKLMPRQFAKNPARLAQQIISFVQDGPMNVFRDTLTSYLNASQNN